MKYLILAQICSTIGTPKWVATLCYVCFGYQLATSLMKGVKESVKVYRKKYKKTLDK